MADVKVHGASSPRFRACRDVVQYSLAAGEDLGCSLAVVQDGEIVVDLWGGHADAARTLVWKEDTLVNIWSTTKSILAFAVSIAVERQQLRYADPIACAWPEFASNGKAAITLDLVLSHRAGLHGLPRAMSAQDVYDWHPCVRAFEAMAPAWPPGSRCVYHALSVGHIAGEALRRVDGRMPGRFVAEEIAAPLGLDLFIGLPAKEEHRVADLVSCPGVDDWIAEQDRAGYRNSLLSPAITALTPNRRAWRAADIPAANGHATARALAVLHGLLAQGGGGLISTTTMDRATDELFHGTDVSLDETVRYGAGYRLGGPGSPLGPSRRAFGHNGWGGAFAFADPVARLGVAYVMNRMLGRGADLEARHARMIASIYNSL